MHVPAHRWADVAAGRISPRRRRRIERHAAGCQRRQRVRQRVEGAIEVMGAGADAPAAELRWDHIWARIYWVTSSERRATQRQKAVRRPRRVALLLPAALAVAALAAWQAHGLLSPETPVTSAPGEPARAASPTPVAPAPVRPAPIRGVVTFAQGEVTRDGAALAFDAPVEAGAILGTGAGRVTVQLGPGSGFTLGPETRLQVRSLDQGAVELEVDGTVSVEVSARAPEQRFVVRAGDRQVRVRGTAFRVDHRDGDLDVACSHGQVVVAEAGAEAAVDAGHRLRLGAGDSLRQAAVETFARARDHVTQDGPPMPLLPAWTDAEALYATSATLALEGTLDTPVMVDGVEVGRGDFSLRVMSGRHRVSAPGGDGGGSWVETPPGTVSRTQAAPPPAATEKRPRAEVGSRTRRRQLARFLADNARVDGCLRPLEKQGLLAGSHVELELGLGADGTITHLNLRGNLPRTVADCVHDVVERLDFPHGPRAELRYRLDF